MEAVERYEGGRGGVVNFEDFAMDVGAVVRQINLIQNVMATVMKEGEHYGKIPGCGPKPTLLKPGAEKLGMTFRLAPYFTIEPEELGDGHRGYQITCTLRHIPTDVVVGQGVGYCSTMESKYRYRWDSTGKDVPSDYWNSRNPAILGGDAFIARKVDGKWLIFQRVEHDNPADYFNTCEKMAKKRAHVDAMLSATAASDIFTQDVEDLPNGSQETNSKAAGSQQHTAGNKPPIQEPGRKSDGQSPHASEPQLKKIAVLMDKCCYPDSERHNKASDVVGRMVASMKDLTVAEASKVIEALVEEEKAMTGQANG